MVSLLFENIKLNFIIAYFSASLSKSTLLLDISLIVQKGY